MFSLISVLTLFEEFLNCTFLPKWGIDSVTLLLVNSIGIVDIIIKFSPFFSWSTNISVLFPYFLFSSRPMEEDVSSVKYIFILHNLAQFLLVIAHM